MANASLLVSLRGDPVPPQSVVARLRALTGDKVKIEWVAGAHVPYWGYKKRWDDGDPRWQNVRTGQMSADSAYDLEMMFPQDCSVQDLAAYVESRYSETRHRSSSPSQDAEKMVEDAKRRMEQARESQVMTATTNSLERHERESRHALRVRAGAERAHPMVKGGFGS